MRGTLPLLLCLVLGAAPAVADDGAEVRGELVQLGATRLPPRPNRALVQLGPSALDEKLYATLSPGVTYTSSAFELSLFAPLRFELLDTRHLDVANPATFSSVGAGLGGLRLEDYQGVEGLLRPLQHVTFGGKEQPVHLDVSRWRAYTLGHGQLVRRYTPSLSGDDDNLFGAADAAGELGGFEVLAGPLPFPRLVGALVFVKPFGRFDQPLLRTLSVGLEAVSDLAAPRQLVTRRSPADGRLQVAVDDDGRLVPAPGRQGVSGLGLSAELRLVDAPGLRTKVYGDAHALLLPDDEQPVSDPGFALGALVRARLAGSGHRLRTRMELRTFGPTYLPSYFDVLYEADRLQLHVPRGSEPLATDRPASPTKAALLLSRRGEPWRVGAFFEAAWSYRGAFGLAFTLHEAMEASTGRFVPEARGAALHLEALADGPVQLFATYHLRYPEDFRRAFTLQAENELLFAGLRLLPASWLALRFELRRGLQARLHEDDFGPRRPGPAGAGGPWRYSTLGLSPTWAAALALELSLPLRRGAP